MNAEEFVRNWDQIVKKETAEAAAQGVPGVADDLKLVSANPSILNDPDFPGDAARFLVEAGLPGSCAPFLTFDAVARGPESLSGYYGPEIAEVLGPDASRLLRIIGFDGAGSPICLDLGKGGEVVWLDHDWRFEKRKFVASDVGKLAEALVILHSCPHEEFVTRLLRCDPPAADDSAFLPAEVRMLLD